MDAPRTQRFLIVENDTKYAEWLRHAVGAGWPGGSVVILDWTSFSRVRTAMTVRDYDIVMLSLLFDEGIEEPTTDSFDWIRKLRSQPGFPEMIIVAEAGSELSAIRTLRLGAADYLPKRLMTPSRLQRSIKLTLRAMDKEAQRRAGRQAQADKPPESDKHAETLTGSVKVTQAVPSHISTHTSASLAQAAAQLVTPPKAVVSPPAAPTAVAPTVVAPTPAPHVATHTGASLAKAAMAALAAHTPRVDTAKEQPKESKPVAPENHQIPGYAILQKIGESEAAAVYLAIAEDQGHNCALKISKRKHSTSDVADTGQRSIMFQREFEAIAALDHPSIIDLFDYGIHEGVEFLAMEYFPVATSRLGCRTH